MTTIILPYGTIKKERTKILVPKPLRTPVEYLMHKSFIHLFIKMRRQEREVVETKIFMDFLGVSEELCVFLGGGEYGE